jgi:hypothetical protein
MLDGIAQSYGSTGGLAKGAAPGVKGGSAIASSA